MPINVAHAVRPYRSDPAEDRLTSDRLFDRNYALELLDSVLETVERDFEKGSRCALFNQLRLILTDGPGAIPYAKVAFPHGMSELAVQQAASRPRRRYHAALWQQIAKTLDAPNESSVDEEIRYLFRAVGG